MKLQLLRQFPPDPKKSRRSKSKYIVYGSGQYVFVISKKMEELLEKKRFIESSPLFTNNENENPFSNMNIKCSNFLDEVSERGTCPKCNKSRRYYCYNCYVAVKELSDKLPVLRLPVKIDVIKHPKEVDGKSTSAHAAVLAPLDVQIYTYPDFPDYENEDALLIFPGKSAVPFKDWWNSKMPLQNQNRTCDNDSNVFTCSCRERKANLLTSEKTHLQNTDRISCIYSQTGEAQHHTFPFRKIVFIDSTWRQTKKLYGDPRIRKLPCVVLTSHRSLFWRHQRDKPEEHLSTIEAVYYFLVELYHLAHPDVPYCGHYDNLLFFFKFMYYKIRTIYDPLRLKAYQQS